MKKIHYTFFIFLFFSFVAAGQVFSQDKTAMAPLQDISILTSSHTTPNKLDSFDSHSAEYTIGPENVLQIDVYYGKGDKISQKVRVSSQGTIDFPLVGQVEAGGLTVARFQEKLRKLLEKDFLVDPQVTVFIEEYSTVSIMGEVKKPGVYPIKGRLTVVELISLAEGFTKIAAQNKVKVIHTKPDGQKEQMVARVYDFMNKNDDQANVVLSSGDVVIVPESLF